MADIACSDSDGIWIALERSSATAAWVWGDCWVHGTGTTGPDWSLDVTMEDAHRCAYFSDTEELVPIVCDDVTASKKSLCRTNVNESTNT